MIPVGINGALNLDGIRSTGCIRRRGLDGNGDRRSILIEPNGRIRGLGRTVGIEPEVIQSAPAQCIRVLVLREGLRAPSQRGGGLIRSPDSVAKSGASLGAIVGDSRMIRQGMKSNVAHRN